MGFREKLGEAFIEVPVNDKQFQGFVGRAKQVLQDLGDEIEQIGGLLTVGISVPAVSAIGIAMSEFLSFRDVVFGTGQAIALVGDILYDFASRVGDAFAQVIDTAIIPFQNAFNFLSSIIESAAGQTEASTTQLAAGFAVLATVVGPLIILFGELVLSIADTLGVGSTLAKVMFNLVNMFGGLLSVLFAVTGTLFFMTRILGTLIGLVGGTVASIGLLVLFMGDLEQVGLALDKVISILIPSFETLSFTFQDFGKEIDKVTGGLGKVIGVSDFAVAGILALTTATIIFVSALGSIITGASSTIASLSFLAGVAAITFEALNQLAGGVNGVGLALVALSAIVIQVVSAMGLISSASGVVMASFSAIGSAAWFVIGAAGQLVSMMIAQLIPTFISLATTMTAAVIPGITATSGSIFAGLIPSLTALITNIGLAIAWIIGMAATFAILAAGTLAVGVGLGVLITRLLGIEEPLKKAIKWWGKFFEEINGKEGTIRKIDTALSELAKSVDSLVGAEGKGINALFQNLQEGAEETLEDIRLIIRAIQNAQKKLNRFENRRDEAADREGEQLQEQGGPATGPFGGPEGLFNFFKNLFGSMNSRTDKFLAEQQKKALAFRGIWNKHVRGLGQDIVFGSPWPETLKAINKWSQWLVGKAQENAQKFFGTWKGKFLTLEQIARREVFGDVDPTRPMAENAIESSELWRNSWDRMTSFMKENVASDLDATMQNMARSAGRMVGFTDEQMDKMVTLWQDTMDFIFGTQTPMERFLSDVNRAFDQFGRDVSNTMAEMITSFEADMEDFADIAEKLAQRIISSMLETFVISKAVNALKGAILPSGGNQTAKVLGRVSQAFAQGSLNPLGGGGGKQHGGPVTSTESFLVGEKGPELFVPNQAGQVISNRKLQNRGSGDKGSNKLVIEINNNAEDSVDTNKKEGRGGPDLLQLFLNSAAQDVREGGQLGQAIQSSFGQSRSGSTRT